MKICRGEGEKINRAINVAHRQLASGLAYVAYTKRNRKKDDALVGISLNNNRYSLQLAPLRHNESGCYVECVTEVPLKLG